MPRRRPLRALPVARHCSSPVPARSSIESAEIEGVITFTEGGVSRALTLSTDADPALVTAATGAATAPGPAVLRLPAAGEGAGLTFWAALAFAFAGGLILNLMPCVLPVLFIKAIGFVQLARSSRAEVREQGLLFLCGVLATFLVLAGTVIAFAALGSSVGWGYQLQSPPVVIALAVVMTLIGFNLLGAFELGTSAGGVGQDLASRGGRVGAFMTGALAVIVATPCTAPFMGAAMGFAVTQPPAVGALRLHGAGARLRGAGRGAVLRARPARACCRSPAAGWSS